MNAHDRETGPGSARGGGLFSRTLNNVFGSGASDSLESVVSAVQSVERDLALLRRGPKAIADSLREKSREIVDLNDRLDSMTRAIRELESLNKIMERDMARSKERAVRLERESAEKNRIVVHVQQELSTISQEVSELTVALGGAARERDALTEQLRIAEAQARDLQAEIKDKDRELIRTAGELNTLRDAADQAGELAGRVRELGAERLAVSRDLEQARAEREGLRRSLREADEQLAALERAAGGRACDIEELRASKQAAQERIVALEQEEAAGKQENRNLARRMADIEQERNVLLAGNQALEQTTQSAQTAMREAVDKAAKLREVLDRNERKMREAAAALEEIQAGQDELKRAARLREQEAQALRDRQADLEETVSALKRINIELEDQNRRLFAEQKQTESRQGQAAAAPPPDWEQALQEKEDIVQAVKQQVADYEMQLEFMERKVAELMENNAAGNAPPAQDIDNAEDAESLARELEEARDRIARLEQELAAPALLKESLTATLSDMQEANKAKDEQIQSMARLLHGARQDQEKARLAIEDRDRAVREFKAEIDKMSAVDVQAMEQRIRDLECELETRRQQIHDLESANEELGEHNLDLARELSEAGTAAGAKPDEPPAPPHGAELLAAMARKDAGVVCDLLERGCDSNARDEAGNTALHLAAGSGDADLAQRLIAAGADVLAANNNGGHSLHRAANAGDADMVRLLLDAGADPAARTSRGITALHLAVKMDHPAVVSMLLEAGADPALATPAGHTPLHLAAANGSKALVEMFLRAGLDRNAASEDGSTARDLAEEAGHMDIAELLGEKTP